MPPQRRLARLLLGAWIAALFTISSLPDAGDVVNQPWQPPHADKIAHAAGYAILGALNHLAGGPPALLTAVAVGTIDEAVIQRIVPERDTDAFDLIADALGAVVGAAIARRFRPSPHRRG